MKTALVLLADGFEEIEALTPVDYLRRAGVQVIMAATGKDTLTVNGSHGIPVVADVNLSALMQEASPLPDAVVVPGGMPGASNIASCENAINFVHRMVQEQKLVAAICAAPAVVLSHTGALEGKNWTCYPGMEDYSTQSQLFKETHLSGIPFVTDGNTVTARGPGAAEQFAMELVRILCGEETKEKVKAASCQR